MLQWTTKSPSQGQPTVRRNSFQTDKQQKHAGPITLVLLKEPLKGPGSLRGGQGWEGGGRSGGDGRGGGLNPEHMGRSLWDTHQIWRARLKDSSTGRGETKVMGLRKLPPGGGGDEICGGCRTLSTRHSSQLLPGATSGSR